MEVFCGDIIDYMEHIAPSEFAEEWDNVGLMLGSRKRKIQSILLCMDVTSKVVDEAVNRKVDLIISHHPFIFKGIKKLNEDDVKGNMIFKLIKNDINVYSAHTNLDIADDGVNCKLAERLELTEVVNLKDAVEQKLYKVVVFVPKENAEAVREAMCNAGAGYIGNYSNCTFTTKGTGSFKPLENTNPYIGEKGKLEKVEEERIETIVPEHLLQQVIHEMIAVHPYEEVAYDVYEVFQKGKKYGLGKVGLLKEQLVLKDFINFVKKALETDSIRLIGDIDKTIKKVAVYCGSFDNDLLTILRHNTDILITGDIKYHTAVDALESGISILDAGHFNTEKIILPSLAGILSKRFPGVDVSCSKVENDPFKTY